MAGRALTVGGGGGACAEGRAPLALSPLPAPPRAPPLPPLLRPPASPPPLPPPPSRRGAPLPSLPQPRGAGSSVDASEPGSGREGSRRALWELGPRGASEAQRRRALLQARQFVEAASRGHRFYRESLRPALEAQRRYDRLLQQRREASYRELLRLLLRQEKGESPGPKELLAPIQALAGTLPPDGARGRTGGAGAGAGAGTGAGTGAGAGAGLGRSRSLSRSLSLRP